MLTRSRPTISFGFDVAQQVFFRIGAQVIDDGRYVDPGDLKGNIGSSNYPQPPARQNATLIRVKPDGVERNLIGEVLARIERKMLDIVALELGTVERELAEQHYAEHGGKPFFGDLLEFITWVRCWRSS